ncbi:hypothetical protein [Phenylobacterium parvum]|uniref:DUF2059 domain-containing protein n=1 Tax=Phenylobacterium parvum TaxID=2201350 RepID=A0A2Z3I209_9CAUL|nr:hypothetical protein [Phenylobacterium parvum]AWM77828.1 hypothetical protein HYN04_08655 [Phenylobacterium parvum]
MRAILFLLVPALALGACATVPTPGARDLQEGADVTTAGLGNALATPLKDVNIVRDEIPLVLQEAAKAPYARPNPMTCARITALLLPLNGALGPDLDDMKIDEDSLGEMGGEAALDAIADFAAGSIPFRSWVRRFSGAEKHQKRVRAAIAAGEVRRAYLKGLGEQLKCAPPATPNRRKPAAK